MTTSQSSNQWPIEANLPVEAPVKFFVASLGWALSVLISSSALALTGAQLYEHCDNKGDAAKIACGPYVRGFIDGMVLGKTLGERSPTLYCPPKGGMALTQGQLVIVKYLKDHPERLHEEAGFLAFEAFLVAFHCR